MTIPQFTAGQVLTAAELNAMVDAINAGGGKMEVTRFTADGTFTVPAGVTYAVAHITGGGGGVGASTAAGAGGDSSVAFASGTITAAGGNKINTDSLNDSMNPAAGAVNSGHGATFLGARSQVGLSSFVGFAAQDGATIVAGAAVTPAATITVVVGAGGTAGQGGAAGGSGYVWIEYQV